MTYRVPSPSPVEPPAALESPPPPSASEGAHPFAISEEEGFPLIPQEAVIQKLLKLVALKHGAVTMYTTYADAIRAPFRDAIYEHFKTHAEEERTGIYDYNMKLMALGGTPSTKAVKAPDAAGSGIQVMFTNVIQYEKDLVAATRDLLKACGEYDGLRLLLEENLLADQRHLDDARRMLVTIA